MEKSEIREIINFMNSIYVHRQIKISSELINVWYDMIGEYDKEQVVSIIKRIAKEENYAPNLATLTEELNKAFIVRHSQIGANYVVFVDFKNSRFPFNFKNKIDAKDLVDFLKGNPSMNDIEFYHEEFLREKNLHIGIDMSDKLLQEINEQAKKDFYRRRARK